VVGMVNMNQVYIYVDVINKNMVVVPATHSVNMNIERMCAQKILISQVVGIINMNEVYMDLNVIMHEDNPEQVVDMNNIDKDHRDMDVIDSDVIVIGINFDCEYNEDVVETEEMQVHEKPEKRDSARRTCSQSSQPMSTPSVTQSGTITRAVARYDNVPIVTLFVLKLTSQSSGVKLTEMKEVMLKTNLKGKYNNNLDSECDEVRQWRSNHTRNLRRRMWGTTPTATPTLTPSTTRMRVWR
jgi:hypothetical protein